jgi:hypothetical protein
VLAFLLMAIDLKNDGLKAQADIAKQMITLCSGAVGFTVTFLDKFTARSSGPPAKIPVSLYVAWGLFGLDIIFALWTLMAITGTLDVLDRKNNGWATLNEQQDEIATGKSRSEHVNRPAMAMLITFLLAVLAMIWTGFRLQP